MNEWLRERRASRAPSWKRQHLGRGAHRMGRRALKAGGLCGAGTGGSCEERTSPDCHPGLRGQGGDGAGERPSRPKPPPEAGQPVPHPGSWSSGAGQSCFWGEAGWGKSGERQPGAFSSNPSSSSAQTDTHGPFVEPGILLSLREKPASLHRPLNQWRSKWWR